MKSVGVRLVEQRMLPEKIMSIITSCTRMWLTRSVQPFTFRNEYDRRLPFADCRNLGLYIHIPFCRSICNFCPYCKVPYEKELFNDYIDALIKEIHLLGSFSKNVAGTDAHASKQTVTSLYFGGGTPALAAGRLEEILAAVKDHFQITGGIGIELHPDNVTVPVLQTLKQAGITKLSIGIQSFSKKYQKILGRKPVPLQAMAKALRMVPFETVSMDFIFALPGQTFYDLRSDIDLAFANGANHIAVYPFIDFTFTASGIPAMPKRKKRRLLDQITAYCRQKGYVRTSIWTFAKDRRAEYSSMIRENFLGFGCSATTLLKKQFKINTFSVAAYIKRVNNGQLPTALTVRFTPRQRMVYYLFWAAYGMEVSENAFAAFFSVPLQKMYGRELRLAERLGFVIRKNAGYRLTAKGAFYFHYYENFYTLAYIDKMWDILRKEAFPPEIRL